MAGIVGQLLRGKKLLLFVPTAVDVPRFVVLTFVFRHLVIRSCVTVHCLISVMLRWCTPR